MTRKDYRLVADSIRDEYDYYNETESPSMAHAAEIIAEKLADAFAGDNPRFDRGKFLHAALGN